MNILVACEYSGRVRDAFIAKGHNVLSCDVLPSDLPGPHFQGDVCNLLRGDWVRFWDMLIAFPPCTYLCNGGRANITRRPHLKWLDHQVPAEAFFMSMVNSNISKIAVENPVGIMSTKYKKPDQIIKPWMFGYGYTKPTCLWLKNLPKLTATDIIEPPYKKLDFWSTKRNPGGRSLKSLTFIGIANAMADQWG